MRAFVLHPDGSWRFEFAFAADDFPDEAYAQRVRDSFDRIFAANGLKLRWEIA